MLKSSNAQEKVTEKGHCKLSPAEISPDVENPAEGEELSLKTVTALSVQRSTFNVRDNNGIPTVTANCHCLLSLKTVTAYCIAQLLKSSKAQEKVTENGHCKLSLQTVTAGCIAQVLKSSKAQEKVSEKGHCKLSPAEISPDVENPAEGEELSLKTVTALSVQRSTFNVRDNNGIPTVTANCHCLLSLKTVTAYCNAQLLKSSKAQEKVIENGHCKLPLQTVTDYCIAQLLKSSKAQEKVTENGHCQLSLPTVTAGYIAQVLKSSKPARPHGTGVTSGRSGGAQEKVIENGHCKLSLPTVTAYCHFSTTYEMDINRFAVL